MTGGMNRRGEYASMSDRVASGRDEARPDAPQIRHCWVTDSNGRLPGLLLEWRQVEGVWRGRVVRPVEDDGAWVVVDEWLPGGLLDPVVDGR
jgi:hypothetical protein